LRTSLNLCKTSIDQIELTKVFGRIADKNLLLDIPGAGTPEMANCCHGGCDNCNYSHIFDSLSSGRPKWIALYTTREFADGRSHISMWSEIFKNDEYLNEESFISQLSSLPYKLCLGPSITINANDDGPSSDALKLLWNRILNNIPEDLRSENSHRELKSTQVLTIVKVYIFRRYYFFVYS